MRASLKKKKWIFTLGPGNMEDQANRSSLPEAWKYSKNGGDMLVHIYIYICNYLHNFKHLPTKLY